MRNSFFLRELVILREIIDLCSLNIWVLCMSERDNFKTFNKNYSLKDISADKRTKTLSQSFKILDGILQLVDNNGKMMQYHVGLKHC